jgi:DNA-binding CsgD family transcriptional regulator
MPEHSFPAKYLVLAISQGIFIFYFCFMLIPPNNALTNREKEVLMLVLQEQTSVEISNGLGLSIQTINTHRKNILKKTRSKTLIGLVKYAIRAKMIKDYYFKDSLFRSKKF